MKNDFPPQCKSLIVSISPKIEIAENYSLNPDETIPNVTKTFSSSGTKEKITSKSGQPGIAISDTEKVNIEYLLLRQVMLKDFNKPDFADFEPLLERYNQGQLTEDDHRHIRNTMNKVKEVYPSRSLQNLKNCYLMDYLIKKELRSRSKPEDRSFLESILKQLHQKYKLSPKQVSAALKWFKDMKGIKKGDVENLTFYE